jgi:D-3-phosphoglycerate dehydrogenase / 2-oxoglutarate reductase
LRDRRRQKVRVYVADTEASERMGMARHLTAKRGFDARFGEDLMASAEAVEENLGDAEILCVALGRVSARAIENASDLRLIVKCGIGVDNIDSEAAKRRGIPVLRVGGVNFRGVAEYVIGAIIALNRHMVALDRAVRAGEWEQLRGGWAGRLPALTGKTLGIIGVGSIGAEVARLAGTHGMELLGFDPYLDPARAAELGVTLLEKEELLERADVVSVHVLLDDSTRGMLSDQEFGRMKPTALLVNSARGPIVDEAALARALAGNEIAAAALDVFEEEPLDPASPLVTLDNCLLSPHLAGCTDHGYDEIGTAAAGLIESFVGERPVPAGAVVVEAGELLVDRA